MTYFEIHCIVLVFTYSKLLKHLLAGAKY